MNRARVSLRFGCFASSLVFVSIAGCAPKSPAISTAMPSVSTPQPATSLPALTMSDVLARSSPSDWRPLDPENTLYLELPAGRVIIELAPAFAPNHVANVKALARESYFDGLKILRSQDNYVVQWGDPDGDDETKRRAIQVGQKTLTAEFDRTLSDDLVFTPLPDGDVYAPEVGHSGGFPAARDTKSHRGWLAHCYGMLGAGRGNDADSGSGTELYVVIGHSPRHLDRNVTLFGRVVRGMELLATQPRGKGAMGFYEKPEEHQPLDRIRVAADVPEDERTNLEILRTDTPTFQAVVASRRHRREEWFKSSVGHIELCNVHVPIREIAPGGDASRP